jgi:hypothetical protein
MAALLDRLCFALIWALVPVYLLPGWLRALPGSLRHGTPLSSWFGLYRMSVAMYRMNGLALLARADLERVRARRTPEENALAAARMARLKERVDLKRLWHPGEVTPADVERFYREAAGELDAA